MKNTKLCPKCGSTEVFRVENWRKETSVIFTGFMSMVPVYRYVCWKCGYTEEWIDPADLDKLKKVRL